MALYLIGLGVGDKEDITLRGRKMIKKCDLVYLENYTSIININKKKLFNKKIILADRKLVEETNELVNQAKEKKVALLIAGDPLTATTHIELLIRAKKEKVKCEVVHNASIINTIAETGLQLYKFGKITSIPFEEKNFSPENFYDVIKENQSINAHSLILLDLRSDKKRFVTIKEAINRLLEIEKKRKENVFSENTLCIGCARLGSKDQKIIVAKAKELIKKDFGRPPYCLVIPSKLHFIEEEALHQR